ncbi:protein trapped in endoderm-1-like [Aphidius gifuensis]|uniref:protein trapped in endoderm-1-like n=1 Tax=Aphidius gifuensis TaxID=684658 RepID=UPI001CDCB416|nr:protein trapped in endoderm-1-like [Aphidius gifuensis]
MNSSVLMNGDDNEKSYPQYIAIIAASFAILFCIIGTLGNGLTVIAFAKYKKLRRQPTTIFIINLTISDLMLSTICMPSLAIDFLTSDVIDGILCKISPMLFYGNFSVSLFSLMAIAINRYILIVKPAIHNKIYTTKNIIIMLASIWIFSYSLLLPTIFEIWGTFGLDKKTMICEILEKDGDFASPKTILIIVGFFLPCSVISFSYYRIYQKIEESRKKMLSHSPTQTRTTAAVSSKTDSQETRITKLMFTIFIGFLACFLPTFLVNTIDYEENYPIFHVGDSITSWASVVINPFIYVSTNKLYRTAYRKIFSQISEESVVTIQHHNNNSNRQLQASTMHPMTSSTENNSSYDSAPSSPSPQGGG